jgi:hypothetical protein
MMKKRKALALAIAFLLDCKSKNDSLTAKKLRTRQERIAAFWLWLSKISAAELFLPGLSLLRAVELYVMSHKTRRIIKEIAEKLGLECIARWAAGETVERTCLEDFARAELNGLYDRIRARLCNA